jgi:hypothetical protein
MHKTCARLLQFRACVEGKESEMAESSVELERRVQELETELRAIKGPRKTRRRVTFEFVEETYQLLRRQADVKNTSMANIVRDAIGWGQWLEETVEKGQLYVKEEDGEIYRVKRL